MHLPYDAQIGHQGRAAIRASVFLVTQWPLATSCNLVGFRFLRLHGASPVFFPEVFILSGYNVEDPRVRDSIARSKFAIVIQRRTTRADSIDGESSDNPPHVNQ